MVLELIGLGIGNNLKVQASETSIVETEGTESLEKIIDTVSEHIDIHIDEGEIELDAIPAVIDDISQEDIDNLNSLAELQGIKYDQPLTKEYLVQLLENNSNAINEEIEIGNLEMLKDGSLIDSNDEDFYVQGGSTYDKFYWWGIKRYMSTSAANKWAYKINTAANINAVIKRNQKSYFDILNEIR